MCAYFKYRSPNEIIWALDIILNKRLFCADWKELNDHREGEFWAAPEAIDKVIEAKEKYKVCSLSRRNDIYLLWAHYAADFTGLAVEIELPKTDIEEVEYTSERRLLRDIQASDVETKAKKILTYKYSEWENEKESRIICSKASLEEEKYYDVSVKGVIAGQNMKDSLYKALELICTDKAIALKRAKIDNNGKVVIQ